VNIYQKILERAVALKGVSRLVRDLGTSDVKLHLWLQAEAAIPATVKAKILDLVLDADVSAPTVPRVLVVDDDAASAYTLVRIVRSLGYCADMALSGDEAIEMARVLQPQVILLDLRMPDIDGCDLALRLRSEGRRIIAATAYGEPEERKRTRAAGFEAHLLKPIDTSMLEPYLPRRTSATMR
jgi:CheY-like chemotaxis protein